MTQRLADAYRRLVDHDFVGQYLKRYVEGAEARAFCGWGQTLRV
jgi:hypothetical protein